MRHRDIISLVTTELSDHRLLGRFEMEEAIDAGRARGQEELFYTDPLRSRALRAQCYAVGEALWRRHGCKIRHPDLLLLVDEEILDAAMRARFSLAPLNWQEVERRRYRRGISLHSFPPVIP